MLNTHVEQMYDEFGPSVVHDRCRGLGCVYRTCDEAQFDEQMAALDQRSEAELAAQRAQLEQEQAAAKGIVGCVECYSRVCVYWCVVWRL